MYSDQNQEFIEKLILWIKDRYKYWHNVLSFGIKYFQYISEKEENDYKEYIKLSNLMTLESHEKLVKNSNISYLFEQMEAFNARVSKYKRALNLFIENEGLIRLQILLDEVRLKSKEFDERLLKVESDRVQFKTKLADAKAQYKSLIMAYFANFIPNLPQKTISIPGKEYLEDPCLAQLDLYHSFLFIRQSGLKHKEFIANVSKEVLEDEDRIYKKYLSVFHELLAMQSQCTAIEKENTHQLMEQLISMMDHGIEFTGDSLFDVEEDPNQTRPTNFASNVENKTEFSYGNKSILPSSSLSKEVASLSLSIEANQSLCDQFTRSTRRNSPVESNYDNRMILFKLNESIASIMTTLDMDEEFTNFISFIYAELLDDFQPTERQFAIDKLIPKLSLNSWIRKCSILQRQSMYHFIKGWKDVLILLTESGYLHGIDISSEPGWLIVDERPSDGDERRSHGPTFSSNKDIIQKIYIKMKESDHWPPFKFSATLYSMNHSLVAEPKPEELIILVSVKVKNQSTSTGGIFRSSSNLSNMIKLTQKDFKIKCKTEIEMVDWIIQIKDMRERSQSIFQEYQVLSQIKSSSMEDMTLTQNKNDLITSNENAWDEFELSDDDVNPTGQNRRDLDPVRDDSFDDELYEIDSQPHDFRQSKEPQVHLKTDYEHADFDNDDRVHDPWKS